MNAGPREQSEVGIGTPTVIRLYADEAICGIVQRGVGDRAAINRQFDG